MYIGKFLFPLLFFLQVNPISLQIKHFLSFLFPPPPPPHVFWCSLDRLPLAIMLEKVLYIEWRSLSPNKITIPLTGAARGNSVSNQVLHYFNPCFNKMSHPSVPGCSKMSWHHCVPWISMCVWDTHYPHYPFPLVQYPIHNSVQTVGSSVEDLKPMQLVNTKKNHRTCHLSTQLIYCSRTLPQTSEI